MLPDLQKSKQNPPKHGLEWLALAIAPVPKLEQMGLKVWAKDENTVHWLYPAEWYEHIPQGLFVTTLERKQGWFDREQMPKGSMPYLPYGFLQLKESNNV